jgi:hypothetical protein
MPPKKPANVTKPSRLPAPSIPEMVPGQAPVTAQPTPKTLPPRIVLALDGPALQLEFTCKWRPPFSAFEEPEKRHGGQNGGAHHQIGIEVLQEEHSMYYVVLVETGGAEQEAEGRAHAYADNSLTAHRAPPVAR